MRLYKRGDGIFYINLRRGKSFSLKTKDVHLAKNLFKQFEKDMMMFNFYEQLLVEHQKVLQKVDLYFKKIKGLVDVSFNGDIYCNDNSERKLQKEIIPILIKNFNIKDLQEQKECRAGIVDIYCSSQNKNIIIELKAEKIKEQHLGQCLRYLNDAHLKADELWLMGTGINSSALIFKDFKTIKLFRIEKSKGRYRIKPVRRLNYR